MATFKKRGEKWRVQVRFKGVKKSKTFTTKAAAKAWAAKLETEIEELALGKIPDKKVCDLLRRYMDEITPHKKSPRREIMTLKRMLEDPLASIPIREITSNDIDAWRDRRLESVSGSTVVREWNTLSHVFTTAIKKWKWLQHSPTRNAQRPKENPPRTRRPTQKETDKIIHVSGYDKDQPPNSVMAKVGAIYLLAIETAMREGEIAGITEEHVHPKHVHLPDTKNGSARDVPLSLEARRILSQVMAVTKGCDTVFGITAASIDANFRKIKKKAGIEGLRFHDTRREALTRMAKKLGVMELAKTSGHKDLKILQETYYAPDAADLADKLD